jgi:transcriptional regulator GlxA family with amidase domain
MPTLVQHSPQPIRVGVLLISGFAMIAYASAIDALRAANQVAGRTLYNWYNISPDGLPAIANPAANKPASRIEKERLLIACSGDLQDLATNVPGEPSNDCGDNGMSQELSKL